MASRMRRARTALDDFGNAGLALSDDGNTLAVGAPRSRSTTRPGNVYVFGDVGAGQWQRRALLVNEGEPASDLFGLNLSLSGNGRVLAASACGRFTPASGVNRNYASTTPPAAAQACNPLTQQTGVSHGAHVYQRGDTGTWSKAASVVPTLPPLVAETPPLAQNWLFPVLSRDGGTLGIGAYRNFDRDDADSRRGEPAGLLKRRHTIWFVSWASPRRRRARLSSRMSITASS